MSEELADRHAFALSAVRSLLSVLRFFFTMHLVSAFVLPSFWPEATFKAMTVDPVVGAFSAVFVAVGLSTFLVRNKALLTIILAMAYACLMCWQAWATRYFNVELSSLVLASLGVCVTQVKLSLLRQGFTEL